MTQYEKMISELRSALASANDKIRTFEDSKVVLHHAEAHVPIENIPCLKCLNTETTTNREESINLAPDPLPVFPSLELSNARQAWSSLFHDRREIQHSIAILDQREKDLEQKIMMKKQKNNRVESISSSSIRYFFIFIVFAFCLIIF